MKKLDLDKNNLSMISKGLTMLGLVVTGVGFLVTQRLEEKQIEEKIDEALGARGFETFYGNPQ